MRVTRLTVGPFEENGYLVQEDEGPRGYIVDPGDEAERFVAAIGKQGLQPIAIVNTHGHLDHVGAVEALKQEFGIPFWLHPADGFLLEGMTAQRAAFGLPPVPTPSVDHDLADGEEIPLGKETIRVLHTPGHSPGSVTLHAGTKLLVGDVLFAGSVGRIDLPGGSWETLQRSIRERLLVLSDETEVHPGHGPRTSIGLERRTNPFLQGL